MRLRLIYDTFCALGMFALLAACDEVDTSDRYIEVPAAKVERTVLLEDFTGQKCVNCPDAHRIAEALEKQYGEHMVVVAIHCDLNMSYPADNKRYTGLRQPEGQEYYERSGITDGLPMGIVDGHRPAINADRWADAVYNDIQQTTPLSIDMQAHLDGDRIAIECTLLSSESLTGNLVLWIVESGIVARQESSTGRINDYVHNNVFRACVNGLDGDAVNLVSREPRPFSYSIAIKKTDTEAWVPDNLAVVAFVKQGNDVAQAARCSVTLQTN